MNCRTEAELFPIEKMNGIREGLEMLKQKETYRNYRDADVCFTIFQALKCIKMQHYIGG